MKKIFEIKAALFQGAHSKVCESNGTRIFVDILIGIKIEASV